MKKNLTAMFSVRFTQDEMTQIKIDAAENLQSVANLIRKRVLKNNN